MLAPRPRGGKPGRRLEFIGRTRDAEPPMPVAALAAMHDYLKRDRVVPAIDGAPPLGR